jgi:hypothetical protein
MSFFSPELRTGDALLSLPKGRGRRYTAAFEVSPTDVTLLNPMNVELLAEAM